MLNGALAIGGYIGLVSVWAAPVTGASMNPARSLAPMLVAGNLSHYWIYLVGPILGALVAVVFERILRGAATKAGGEAAQGILDEATPLRSSDLLTALTGTGTRGRRKS